MKRGAVRILPLVVAASGTVRGQTIIGTWQGALPTADSSRVALKFEDAGDGLLHGILYQLDKGPGGIALTSVTFTAPDLSVRQVNSNVSYKGKLSPGCKSIDGTWTQDSHSYPLSLVLATAETLWKPSGPSPIPPMSPTADPAFEVATVKPSSADAKGYSYSTTTREFWAKK